MNASPDSLKLIRLSIHPSASLSVCMSVQNSSVCSVTKGYSCLCVCDTKEEGGKDPILAMPALSHNPTRLTRPMRVCGFKNIDTVGVFT